MEVGLKVETAGLVDGGVAILYHLLQIVGRDRGHLVALCVVLMICLVEICLCQESGSGSL